MPTTSTTTLRFWGPAFSDRRSVQRTSASFFAVAVEGEARYLRKICNLSAGGLLIEDRVGGQKPGDVVELEIPRTAAPPVRVRAEVVHVTRSGKIGLRAVDAGTPLADAGGAIVL